MSFPDKTGQEVPMVRFRIREGHRWLTKTSREIFGGKRVVLFALPGAFTPTCSSVHLPRFDELHGAFMAQGIHEIICLSVNDTFVLNEWKRAEHVTHVTMLPDGNGEFTRKMGFLVDKREDCLGLRSWRYAMVVDDGRIEQMFVEPEDGDDPFGVSSAERILHYLDPDLDLPASIVVFSRKGCVFCARARELLRSLGQTFEEHVLHEDFTIKTVRGLSNSTKLPQIFIDGRHIGGAEELEDYFQKSPRSPSAGVA